MNDVLRKRLGATPQEYRRDISLDIRNITLLQKTRAVCIGIFQPMSGVKVALLQGDWSKSAYSCEAFLFCAISQARDLGRYRHKYTHQARDMTLGLRRQQTDNVITLGGHPKTLV
jgi:hypothetical protein